MLNQSSDLELNNKGYLINFDAWSKDFALDLAKEHHLELTECHWHIINFLRDYYSEYGIAPDPREIIKKLGKQINPETPCSRKHLEGLFSTGGCKLACKIAGLPDCHCRGV
ncbi:MAG: TusE/DsrC/DsvC family sulfur relay protein [gamma proteobacterium symbiont of Bathyaustriella thionipta]|nr:TusE/DsrC/DsvC family sulfur relay protein [gamma proteobacterium symbiont of Bathyaustriella thionipta]MCU7949674.1 TusE/DsrC/DsvC family sulfur relay protein [gamma proteobacterium symbiont of Bathyaustriella thionipta]MCU7952222.1 TusE/DsrC/DsvC family sulfur relay protein [gamma proteobacterium symbiont of Bathyaustriella thionipta]MCU7956269.1 TusE/DsrC/DsvC family sulfur relay protein [gamma proteobacterium symbiont of Bathyaustriella thionipta]MCU7968102.1 TusE/DsrC/DsvC family sulfur